MKTKKIRAWAIKFDNESYYMPHSWKTKTQLEQEDDGLLYGRKIVRVEIHELPKKQRRKL